MTTPELIMLVYGAVAVLLLPVWWRLLARMEVLPLPAVAYGALVAAAAWIVIIPLCLLEHARRRKG